MRGICILLLTGGLLFNALGKECFVSLTGSDTNAGLSRTNAFATIQQGVDALAPGDTLTILPGEYFGSVRRDGLGDSNTVTTIRAALPGTVVLRGDVPVHGFQKVDGSRFSYVADLSHTGAVVVVNELDTLKILQKMPNSADLDFMPGVFYHDAEAGKLYMTTSDLQPPEMHHYTASLIGTHGLYLSNARRVVIEGLGATGFNAMKEMPWRGFPLCSVWSIFVANGKDCIIRDCRAWLNGQGIGLSSGTSGGDNVGDNVIERCQAWANFTPFGVGDRGGLTLIEPQRDTIRDSVAFLNGDHGINIRRGVPPEREEANKSLLVNNVAWGNWCDFRVKSGCTNQNEITHCAGDVWMLSDGERALWSLVGQKGKVVSRSAPQRDTIMLMEEAHLNIDMEFADPANHDYRLQATSRFCGSGPDGADRGPFPYQADVFYVKTNGKDEADGLSLGNAWQTLARAAKDLKSGDTLYLCGGRYAAASLQAGPAASVGRDAMDRRATPTTIAIRGRNKDVPVIEGPLALSADSAVAFERIEFTGPVSVSRPAVVLFKNCRFAGGPVALSADSTTALRVEHCGFSGFEEAGLQLSACRHVDLRGNWFANAQGVALALDDVRALQYAGYNGYADVNRAWKIGDRIGPPAAGLEFQAFNAPTSSQTRNRTTAQASPNAAGPYGRPQGPYRDEQTAMVPSLIGGPAVHSVSASTANLEWWLSQPGTCDLAWGDTPEMANTLDNVRCDHYTSFSLVGLQPDRKYFFSIRSVMPEPQDGMDVSDGRLPDRGPIQFQTTPTGATAATYYVAPEGDDAGSGLSRDQAWRTVHHAAGRVKAGDTVMIAGGAYRESVTLRASGDERQPVAFKSMPGEKVVFDGDGRSLEHAFVANRKHFYSFDGFYFVNYNAAVFALKQSDHLQILRCFHDGRGIGNAGPIVRARDCADLRIKNSVVLNGFGGLHTVSCPDLRLEHNVFLRNFITAVTPVNQPHQKMYFRKNIFTDGLPVKVSAPVMEVGSVESLMETDNCYYLRVPDTEKKMFWFYGGESYWRCARLYGWPTNFVAPPVFTDLTRINLQEYQAQFGDTGSFVANPLFQGTLAMKTEGKDGQPLFMADSLAGKKDLDFPDLFATNPEVVQKGIGLIPEDFKDFHFMKSDPPSAQP